MPRPIVLMAALLAGADAFVANAPLSLRSARPSMSSAAPCMSLEMTSVEQMSSTLAGVVAVDGGTIVSGAQSARAPHAIQRRSDAMLLTPFSAPFLSFAL